MRGNGNGAGRGGFRADGFNDFKVHIGGGEGQAVFVCAHEHVGQDWNGVPAFHHAMDIGQRTEQISAVNGEFHAKTIP